MQPAKRRRMDNAISALSRPFRSPLHVDPNKQRPSSEKQDDKPSQATPHTSPTKPTPTIGTVSKPSPIVASGDSQTRTTTGRQPAWAPSPPKSSRISTYDKEYITLQKQYGALNLQFKDISQSLDAATQALKIVQSNQDEELTSLIKKWQEVSRDAAEQLFATAKDRVNCMGGVDTWRERHTKPPDERSSWASQPEFDEDELTTEEKEQLKIAREEAEAESKKYRVHQDQTVSHSQDDHSFTIDMMLKQLNIDLEIIGYDSQAQRWIE